ncbi:MAG: xylulokinase, partial [Clostridiales Family XIII bacterium]|nr:xylulokinase [Clostridiales Family XIII bacterium]
METLLGIDIGTSGTKTALYRADGQRVAAHTEEYPMAQPHNGWAEQDPADWWHAVRIGVRAVLSDAAAQGASMPAAIGLSGQMHGLVLLDAEGGVLRPSILWCDQRTGAETLEMEEVFGRQRIIEVTANPPMTGFTAAKIRWVQKHEPEIWARTAHILLPKDYIRFLLCGSFVSDVSDASGMQLMDVSARGWSDEMLRGLAIERDRLPELCESQDISGHVTAEAAAATGLPQGTPVVGGAGDNAAAAVGMGVVRAGSAFTSLGSSAVIYCVSDELRIDPEGRVHSLCASVPGKWTFMSCTQAAGLSVQWFRDNFCADLADGAASGAGAYKFLDAEAAKIPPGADRLLYLPYLMGERSPHP